MRATALALFCALTTIHAGCGGCGDDAPADPDANVEPDPDADPGDTDPPTSSANPPGGTFFTVPAVTVTADEPATIYYTLDGSEPTTGSASGPSPLVVTGITAGTPLRFFAVDTAGNPETPDHSETYTVDRAATLSIALDGTVTVTDPVAGLTLAGTAVYSDDDDTLDVTLTVTNMEPRLLFNLKAMFGDLGQGAVTGDGTLSGTAFSYYGPEALDAAASKDATFVLTGIDGAVDPVTVALTFRTDAMWAFHGRWNQSPMLVDSSSSGMGAMGDSQPFGFRMADGDSIYHGGVFSPDGRRLFLGPRNRPIVVVKDMTTLEDTLGTSLDDGVGGVRWMRLSPDGESLYVLLLTGEHVYAQHEVGDGAGCENGGATCQTSAPDLALVRLSTSDLTETGRATFVTDAADPLTRGYIFDVSASGTRAAVPVWPPGEIAFIDLTTMTVIDTDEVTAGVQHVDLSATFDDPHAVAFSADGTQLFVAPRTGTGGLAVVDTATFAITTETPTTEVDRSSTGVLARGPDGRIYDTHGGSPELQIYDPVGDAWVEVDLPDTARGIAFLPGDRYATHDGASVIVRGLGDDQAIVLNEDRATGGTDPLLVTGWGNMFAVGPD